MAVQRPKYWGNTDSPNNITPALGYTTSKMGGGRLCTMDTNGIFYQLARRKNTGQISLFKSCDKGAHWVHALHVCVSDIDYPGAQLVILEDNVLFITVQLAEHRAGLWYYKPNAQTITRLNINSYDIGNLKVDIDIKYLTSCDYNTDTISEFSFGFSYDKTKITGDVGTFAEWSEDFEALGYNIDAAFDEAGDAYCQVSLDNLTVGGGDPVGFAITTEWQTIVSLNFDVTDESFIFTVAGGASTVSLSVFRIFQNSDSSDEELSQVVTYITTLDFELDTYSPEGYVAYDPLPSDRTVWIGNYINSIGDGNVGNVAITSIIENNYRYTSVLGYNNGIVPSGESAQYSKTLDSWHHGSDAGEALKKGLSLWVWRNDRADDQSATWTPNGGLSPVPDIEFTAQDLIYIGDYRAYGRKYIENGPNYGLYFMIQEYDVIDDSEFTFGAETPENQFHYGFTYYARSTALEVTRWEKSQGSLSFPDPREGAVGYLAGRDEVTIDEDLGSVDAKYWENVTHKLFDTFDNVRVKLYSAYFDADVLSATSECIFSILHDPDNDHMTFFFITSTGLAHKTINTTKVIIGYDEDGGWSGGSTPVWVNANEIDYADYSAAWKAVFAEEDEYYYIIALMTYYFYWDAGVVGDAVNTYTLTPVALVTDGEIDDPTGDSYEFVTGLRMRQLAGMDTNEYCILFTYTGRVYKKEMTDFNFNTTLTVGWEGVCEGVPSFGRFVEALAPPI